MSVSAIARDLQIPRGTVSYWLSAKRIRQSTERASTPSRCPRCAVPPRPPDDRPAYAHLLGLYLGDGHLVTSARVPVLRIACTDTWPALMDECEDSMRRVLAKNVQRVPKSGCTSVQSYAKHWPCLFPQHGPGRKHERPITLAGWQQELVDELPGDFLRGLIHSDGCRFPNRVVRNGKSYSYPRYMFTNKSLDIMRLCQESLDRLSVPWRMTRPDNLSVARREGVAVLDRWVGAKA